MSKIREANKDAHKFLLGSRRKLQKWEYFNRVENKWKAEHGKREFQTKE